MKYFKYTLITLAILIIGYLLIGFIKPDITYEAEIIVDKPITESWAVLQDESKMGDWLEGFQKVVHVSGTKGTVGSVIDVYFNTDGQEMIIRETITKIVKDESVSMTITSDFMNIDYKLMMAAVDGKTKMSTNTTVVGNGMMTKSFIALMGNYFKTQEDTNLSRLKSTIEKNTESYLVE